jgi:hypothetical protein
MNTNGEVLYISGSALRTRRGSAFLRGAVSICALRIVRLQPNWALAAPLLQKVETGANEQAEKCFRRGIEIAQEQKEKSLELRGATSLSRLWADCGKRAEAPSLLEPVYHWFTEGLETPDLPEARALIAELRVAEFEHYYGV